MGARRRQGVSQDLTRSDENGLTGDEAQASMSSELEMDLS